MELKIYSVFDSKVGAYMNPQCFRSKGEAVRSFTAAVAQEDHDFHRYAEDFTLFELGDWSPLTAKFDMHLTPVPIGKAVEFIAVRDRSLPKGVDVDLSSH